MYLKDTATVSATHAYIIYVCILYIIRYILYIWYIWTHLSTKQIDLAMPCVLVSMYIGVIPTNYPDNGPCPSPALASLEPKLLPRSSFVSCVCAVLFS